MDILFFAVENEIYKEIQYNDDMDVGAILKQVFENNEDFSKSHADLLKGVQSGQSPKITAVFCSDSRVNEQAFAKEPFNYLFAIQNAGNLARINSGSIWYGVKHLNTPILAVIGHTGCGAVYAVMDDPNHLPSDLRQIGEVVKKYSDGAPEDRVQKNAYFVEKNVDEEINYLLEQSWVKDAQKNGTIVLGLVYEINPVLSESGKIRLINYNGRTDEKSLKSLGVPHGRVSK